MYMSAYSFTLLLASVPFLVLAAIAGYTLSGSIGSLVAAALPLLALLLFIYS